MSTLLGNSDYMSYIWHRTIRLVSPKSPPRTNPNNQQIEMLEDLVEYSTDLVEIMVCHKLVMMLWDDPKLYFDAYH